MFRMPAMLTVRFDDAFLYASRLHANQTRRGRETPYIGHLMGVASIVLAHGGDEDQAIAALLHDAAEDQGGHETLRQIERQFGQRVAAIVRDCTDSLDEPQPAWRARKERYVDHLQHAPAATRLVAAADKLFNAREILEDYRQLGDKLWERFAGGRDVLWYYKALVAALSLAGGGSVVDELARTVADLEAATRHDRASDR